MKDRIKKIFSLIPGLSSYNSSKEEASIPQFLDVVIREGCYVSPDCQIGAYTYVGVNTTITKSHIGRFCSIANNVSIGDGEHALDRISTNSCFYDNPYDELTKSDCIIGNDVWIGTKSIIRRGVTIGNGAVVGANSFVNKDVPDFAIVVGTPAKILRYRFERDIIDKINESEWWNSDIEDAKRVMLNLEKLLS